MVRPDAVNAAAEFPGLETNSPAPKIVLAYDEFVAPAERDIEPRSKWGNLNS